MNGYENLTEEQITQVIGQMEQEDEYTPLSACEVCAGSPLMRDCVGCGA